MTREEWRLLAFVAALLAFLWACNGFPIPERTTTMEDALRELLPAVTAVAMTIITGLLTWVSVWLKARFAIEIEAKHRAALHSALETGVVRVLDKLAAAPAIGRADAAIAEAVAYVERSTPDALKALAPTKDHLRDMAIAKAREALMRAAKPADDGWRAPVVPTTGQGG